MDTSTEPFTVLARTTPAATTRTSPLTVDTSASLPSRSVLTEPLTVRPTNFTPAGTCTVKLTLTSLSLVDM